MLQMRFIIKMKQIFCKTKQDVVFLIEWSKGGAISLTTMVALGDHFVEIGRNIWEKLEDSLKDGKTNILCGLWGLVKPKMDFPLGIFEGFWWGQLKLGKYFERLRISGMLLVC